MPNIIREKNTKNSFIRKTLNDTIFYTNFQIHRFFHSFNFRESLRNAFKFMKTQF